MTAKGVSTPLDPVISFRIPVEINNEVESIRGSLRTQDGASGTRTAVGRALFNAILKPAYTGALHDLSRSRGEPFTATLEYVLQLGIAAAQVKS